MKGLHTGTEKAAPAWKEWRREFCWEGVGGPLGAGALSQGLHGRPAGQGGLPPLPAVGGIPHRRRDPPHPGVPEPVL